MPNKKLRESESTSSSGDKLSQDAKVEKGGNGITNGGTGSNGEFTTERFENS